MNCCVNIGNDQLINLFFVEDSNSVDWVSNVFRIIKLHRLDKATILDQ